MQRAQEGAKRRGGALELVSLCELPWVLTPEAKSAVFRMEAAVEMNFVVQAWSVNVRALQKPQDIAACCLACWALQPHQPLCASDTCHVPSCHPGPCLALPVHRAACWLPPPDLRQLGGQMPEGMQNCFMTSWCPVRRP